MAGKKNWISGAIKKPGSLRATAKRDHLIKGDQKLSKSDISQLEHSGSEKTRKRAELAHTLLGFHKK